MGILQQHILDISELDYTLRRFREMTYIAYATQQKRSVKKRESQLPGFWIDQGHIKIKKKNKKMLASYATKKKKRRSFENDCIKKRLPGLESMFLTVPESIATSRWMTN